MADVNVPGIGKLPAWAVFGGVGGTLVLIILYYRSHNSSSAPAATSGTTDAYPPDGTTGNPDDPYSMDPATGQTYGDEQSGAYGVSSYGAYSPGIDYSQGTDNTATDTYNTGPGTFTTNGAWSQYAADYLISTIGLDPGTVSSDLGKYINGQAVDAAGQDIINQAVAIAGYPPVSGTNGYPPSIRLTGTTNPSGSISVPNVKGLDVAQAMQVISSTGLKTGSAPKSVLGVMHIVTGQSPAAGTKVNHGTLVNLTAGVQVPNVVGKSASDALGVMNHAQLHGSVPPPVHGKVHIVTSESPHAGTTVPIGSTVKLTVRTQ